MCTDQSKYFVTVLGTGGHIRSLGCQLFPFL